VSAVAVEPRHAAEVGAEGGQGLGRGNAVAADVLEALAGEEA